MTAPTPGNPTTAAFQETQKLLLEAREVISQMLKLDRVNGDALAAEFLARLRKLKAETL